MTDPENKTPAPAPAAKPAPEAAPASAPEAAPAKPAQDQTPPPPQDEAPPAQAAPSGVEGKIDKLIEVVGKLVTALSQPAQTPKATAAAADTIPDTSAMDQLLAGITQAAQDSAAHAARQSSKTSYETICAESQAAYDAFNPHKKHKEA